VRSAINNRTGELNNTITPDGVYKPPGKETIRVLKHARPMRYGSGPGFAGEPGHA